MKQASALCAAILLQGAEKGMRNTETLMLLKFFPGQAFLEGLCLICQEPFLIMSK